MDKKKHAYIFENTLIKEGIMSNTTKKLAQAVLSGKVKKITTQGDNGKSVGKALENMNKAAAEINDILDSDPELEKKFEDALKNIHFK